MVFTCPFFAHRHEPLVRARVRPGGSVEHREPPEWHGDALNKEGILAYHHIMGGACSMICGPQALPTFTLASLRRFRGLRIQQLVPRRIRSDAPDCHPGAQGGRRRPCASARVTRNGALTDSSG